MNNKKFAVILFVAFSVGILAGWAVTSWTGTVTWQIEEKEFSVWDSLEGGSELTTWDEDLGTLTTPYPTIIRNFYLQNDGNVEIIVEATATSSTGCTPSWSSTGSYTIPVGTTRVHAELTLIIMDVGSYSFEFNIVP